MWCQRNVGAEVALRDPARVREFLARYETTWNASDREGFLHNWKSIATDMALEDPVGSPIRRGWDAAALGPWDLFNAAVSMSLQQLVVCGDEVAFVAKWDARSGSEVSSGVSIETLKFETDGAVLVRVFAEY